MMQMHNNYVIKKSIRFHEDEWEFLKKKMRSLDASGENYKSFSDFVREVMLSNNGYYSRMMKHQMEELRWEIHKIGVNVNQVAKKVNSGMGTPGDVRDLKSDLEKIETLLEQYERKVNEVWQSQS